MKKSVASVVGLLVVACAGAQNTSVHISGGDATSWAMVRLNGAKVAHMGDISGVHVGDVTQDELIVVRQGKGYVITDARTLSEIEKAREPLDKAREARLKVKEVEREARLAVRSLERDVRSIDRDRHRLEQSKERAGGDDKQKVADLDRREAGLKKQIEAAQAKHDAATKKVGVADKERERIRDQVYKKIEQIFDASIAHGQAHPMGG